MASSRSRRGPGLEAEGKLASDGSYIPLVLPHGTPDPHGTIPLYDGSGKLETSDGDLLVAVVGTDASGSPLPLLPPGGWTEIFQDGGSAGGNALGAWYRMASSEPGRARPAARLT